MLPLDVPTMLLMTAAASATMALSMAAVRPERREGMGLWGLPVAALSMSMVVALTALEFLVAFLQAFVFAVLASIYLNDVVNLGHGH